MELLKNISFANPEYFWLLVLVPLIMLYYFLRKKQLFPVMKFSNTALFGKQEKNTNPRFISYLLYTLSLVFIIIALARPQSSLSWQNVTIAQELLDEYNRQLELQKQKEEERKNKESENE